MSGHNVLHHLYQAPFLIPDPGADGVLTVDRDKALFEITTEAGGEARTLAAPTKAGLECCVVHSVDGGDFTLTVNPPSTNRTCYGYNQDNATTIAFAHAGDYAIFKSIAIGSEIVWRAVAQEGTDASIEDLTVDTATITTATITTATIAAGTLTTAAIGGLVLTPAAVTAEHGAGAIGTAVAPSTTRYNMNGTIVTEIKVDLTGLKSKNDADDVIGKAATAGSYIGRYVVATTGIIYMAELICLETPAGGDDDINLVGATSATLTYDSDGAAEAVVIEGGNQVAGYVVQTLTPPVNGFAANDYLYLTAGTGDLDVVYTAGQLIVRLYGHAILA